MWRHQFLIQSPACFLSFCLICWCRSFRTFQFFGGPFCPLFFSFCKAQASLLKLGLSMATPNIIQCHHHELESKFIITYFIIQWHHVVPVLRNLWLHLCLKLWLSVSTCSKVIDGNGLPAVSTSHTLQDCTKRCIPGTEHHQVLLQHLPSQPLFCLSMGYAWQQLCTL